MCLSILSIADTTNDIKRTEKNGEPRVINSIALYSALGVLAVGFGIACIMYRKKLNLLMMKCRERRYDAKQLSIPLSNNNDTAEKKEGSSLRICKW